MMWIKQSKIIIIQKNSSNEKRETLKHCYSSDCWVVGGDGISQRTASYNTGNNI